MARKLPAGRITREEALARLAAIRGFHKDKAMAGIGECPAALDDVPDVEPFRVAEIVALRCGILTDTDTRDGVRYWRSNDRCVPKHVYEDAGWECPPAQAAAYEKETREFLERYRRQQANRVLTDEERFEMRAAFGPGQTVVNVITGKTYRT